MFHRLEYKTKMLILPISIVLAVIFLTIYISFFQIIKGDYMHKSKQFSEQFTQNISLRLNKIQNISENLIKSYDLNTILASGASLSNINRCLSNFSLYDPSINVVILTSPTQIYSDGMYTPELIEALNENLNFNSNDYFWQVNPIDNTSLVFARKLSQKNQYLFVSAKIDPSELLPKGDNIFSTYSSAYILLDNNSIYTLKSEENPELHKMITEEPLNSDAHLKEKLMIRNTIEDYPMTVMTIQSTRYLTFILSIFLSILAFLYIFTLLLCYLCTSCTSTLLSYELEKLNHKLSHGTEQIDELTANLK